MPMLKSPVLISQNCIYLAGTKGGIGRARGGSGRHTARAMAAGAGNAIAKGDLAKTWQRRHSPLHSAGMQELVQKC